ncbi:MAG: DUF4416 domain-containing protein [Nitrospira bacterium HGW-Nitrospira-1]|nr:MAG: DUF4416 domain-containing protein [Nitrospira bacterium HGW-Nitrospira-1]
MGVPHLSEEAALFVGTLFADKKIFDDVLPVLKDNFGNILFQSDIQPWNYSNHYDKELGTPLYRNFIFFNEIIDHSMLADIKLLTNDVEAVYSRAGKRQINLDPGYITLAKVVLASTKNYSHRIYVGKGIYAELALLYKNHQFIAMPYTYNDYKDQTSLAMFMKVRNLLKKPRAEKPVKE